MTFNQSNSEDLLKNRLLSFLQLRGLLLSIFLYCIAIPGVHAAPADDFVTTWKTDNAGTSSSTSITIPTDAGSTYLYDVDWNNDNVFDEFGLTGDVTHDFGAAGNYTIRIQGTFPRILFNNGGDREKLLSVDQWGTQGWTNMNSAFYGCSNLQVLAADTPDLSGVTDLSSMFRGATTFNESIDAWDVSTVTDLSFLFQDATSFNQPLASWNVSNVTTLVHTFYNATSFNQPIEAWETSPTSTTSNITTLLETFRYASSFNQPLDGWDTSGLTSLYETFESATSFNQPLNSWDVSNVTNMVALFRGATSFDQPLNNWDTSSVTRMASLFTNTPFNQDITGWDTSNVTSMNSMFQNNANFNQDISGWNVGNVTRMDNMFNNADSFNQNLNNWERVASPDTSTLANVTRMNGMFQNNGGFNGTIGNWDVSGVTLIYNMFTRASSFNQDISGWDMSNKAGFFNMFYAASSFNQDISGWDVSGATNMSNMFSFATSFDQDLGGWDVSGVGNFASFLNAATLSIANYDSLLTGWDALTLSSGESFNGGNSQYCSASAARANIIATDSWTITDGGVGCIPVITITAPTKLNNASITDTTIQVTDFVNINAANVVVDGATTATTSALSCTQTTPTQVDCTISVDTSGDLVIAATNTIGNSDTATELTYVVDTIDPNPSISISTAGGVDNPTVTFSATDNVAVDHFELTYNTSNGAGGGVGAPTTINPATSPQVLVLDPDEPVHSLTLRVYDTAGNFVDLVVAFPPIITYTTPTPINNAAITDATLTITTPTGNDVTNITVMGYTGTSTPSLTCTGNGADVTDPYAQPVSCTISGINDTGTLTVQADDFGNGAQGTNSESYIIETIVPAIAITAPTKGDNAAITDTTVVVTDDTAVNAGNVVITAVNTAGAFSISAVSCLQTTTSQVDCTLQVDANEGTGDIRVAVTDVADNTNMLDEAGYTIDVTPPTTPAAAPDLQAASDSGSSNTDNFTNDPAVNIDVMCTETGSTINMYSDLPAPNTNIGMALCAATGTLAMAPSVSNEGLQNITYTETDTFGNISLSSPALALTFDTIDPSDPTVNSPVAGDLIDSGGTTNVNVDCVAIGDTISLSHPNLTTNPTTASCAAVGSQIVPVTWNFTTASPEIGTTQTLNAAILDLAGNTSGNIGVNVLISDVDSNSNAIEDAHPNGGDGNGDGTRDVLQQNVSSTVNVVNGQYNAFEATGGCDQISIFANTDESSLAVPDPTNDYPVGLWDFTLNCINIGDSVDVTVYLDQVYDTSTWEFKKFNALTNTYNDVSSSVTYGTANVGATPVTTIAYTIVDGGPLDSDGLANAVVVDPSGPTPSAGGSGGGSGGGGAPQNYPVSVCQADAPAVCETRYPAKSVSTANSYQDYQSCIYSGSNNPFQCTRNWLEANGIATCDVSGTCTALATTTTMATDPAVIIPKIDRAIVRKEEDSDYQCAKIKYYRYPEQRGRGVEDDIFSDAPHNHRAYLDLIDLAEQEIVSGDDDSRLARLDDPIKRAETVKIYTIARQDTIKLNECLRISKFPDVKVPHWFHNFVENIEFNDIVHGYDDGYYRPARTLNKAELLKINAISFGYITRAEALRRAEENNQLWYEPYFEVMAEAGVVPPWVDDMAPDEFLTRGDVFAMLGNTLRQVDERE